jgi:hypothetical protein
MAITEKYVTPTGAGTKDGSSEANAMSWAELKTAMSAGTAAAGDRYNIKSGTYTISASDDTWTNDGAFSSPIWFRGYNNTPGDLDNQGHTAAGLLNTTNFPVISYTSLRRLNASGSSYCFWQNLKIVSSGVNNNLFASGTSNVIYRCSISQASTQAGGTVSLSTGSVLYDCDLSQTAASGTGSVVSVSTNHCRVINCRILRSPAHGITSGGGSVGHLIVSGCVIGYCAGDGINYTGTTAGTVITTIGNTLFSCGGNGISMGAVSFNSPVVAVNNIIINCGAVGIYSNYESTAQNNGFAVVNRFRDNTTANIAGYDDWIGSTGWGAITTDSNATPGYAEDFYKLASGTAQAGAAGTITLSSGSSSTDDYYTGALIYNASGTGTRETRLITGYVGSTKVATVNADWTTNPGNDTVYEIYTFQPKHNAPSRLTSYPYGYVGGIQIYIPTPAEIAAQVWTTAGRSLTG